jgi:hypothetical protein
MNKLFVLGILIILVSLGITGYLTRYEYFKIGRGDGIEMEFRTNRYTNETDALDNRGWRIVQTSKEWADLHWNRIHPAPKSIFDMSKALPLPTPLPAAPEGSESK